MAKDNTLIARAQSGDEGAFADLMRTYHAFVYAIVIGIVNNPHDAEEIVQDAFVNAHRGLPQLEERAKFKSWLAEISRNCARDWLRKQLNDTVPIDEVSEHTRQTPALDEQLIRDEQSELVRRATETLPQKDKEITQAYYFDGASYDELTRTHGLSYKAISVRLSRARQKLAKRLGHLLTGVFVSPITTLKQIYSGGLTAMKVGTIPKITAGAVAIIVLAFIGTRQFISSKADPSPSVEVVTSTESAQSVTQRDAAHKGAVTAPLPEDKPQISAEEMEQIEDFFAKLEGADAQSETDTTQLATDAAFDQDSDSGDTDPSVASEDSRLSAEEVMTAFVEAFRNLDFEVMGSLMTGEGFGNTWLAENDLVQVEVEIEEKVFDKEGVPVPAAKEMTEEMVEKIRMQLEEQLLEPVRIWLNQAEIVNSGHVGDEFGFRLKFPAGNISAQISEILEGVIRRSSPEVAEAGDISEIVSTESTDMIEIPDIHVKMRKVDGEWRVYEME